MYYYGICHNFQPKVSMVFYIDMNITVDMSLLLIENSNRVREREIEKNPFIYNL